MGNETKLASRKKAPQDEKGTSSNEVSEWKEPARLLRVIAHPTRLMILEALTNHCQCVRDLNSLVPVPQPNLSQHCAALRAAHLVDSYASGNLRCYYLVRPTLVSSLIDLLKKDHPLELRPREEVIEEARKDS